MMDLLLTLTVYMAISFAIALGCFMALGVLLLIDLIFKTTFGRRVCRKLFYDE